MILASSVYSSKRPKGRRKTRFSLAMGEVYQGNYRYIPPDKSLSTKSPSNVVGAIQVPGSPNKSAEARSSFGSRRPSTCTTIFEDSAWVDEEARPLAPGPGRYSLDGFGWVDTFFSCSYCSLCTCSNLVFVFYLFMIYHLASSHFSPSDPTSAMKTSISISSKSTLL